MTTRSPAGRGVPASLDIILVNWNAREQLRTCLRSVAETSAAGFSLHRVVVVDNGSRDDSLVGIEQLGVPVQIMRQGYNSGFARACNRGAAGSRADYLLFLNPDSRLFADSLSRPVRFLQQPENRDIAVVSIQLLDEHNDITRSCARFPTAGLFVSRILGLHRLFPRHFPIHIMIDWDHTDSRDVDHVIGAFYLIRRSIFEELGGFDERFFVYWEDIDLSLRVRQAGWRTHYLADAQAFHKGGGTSEHAKVKRLYFSLRSRLQYAFKNFGRAQALALALGVLCVEPLTRFTLAVARHSWPRVVETIGAYTLLWLTLPVMIFRKGKLPAP